MDNETLGIPHSLQRIRAKVRAAAGKRYLVAQDGVGVNVYDTEGYKLIASFSVSQSTKFTTAPIGDEKNLYIGTGGQKPSLLQFKDGVKSATHLDTTLQFLHHIEDRLILIYSHKVEYKDGESSWTFPFDGVLVTSQVFHSGTSFLAKEFSSDEVLLCLVYQQRVDVLMISTRRTVYQHELPFRMNDTTQVSSGGKLSRFKKHLQVYDMLSRSTKTISGQFTSHLLGPDFIFVTTTNAVVMYDTNYYAMLASEETSSLNLLTYSSNSIMCTSGSEVVLLSLKLEKPSLLSALSGTFSVSEQEVFAPAGLPHGTRFAPIKKQITKSLQKRNTMLIESLAIISDCAVADVDAKFLEILKQRKPSRAFVKKAIQTCKERNVFPSDTFAYLLSTGLFVASSYGEGLVRDFTGRGMLLQLLASAIDIPMRELKKALEIGLNEEDNMPLILKRFNNYPVETLVALFKGLAVTEREALLSFCANHEDGLLFLSQTIDAAPTSLLLDSTIESPMLQGEIQDIEESMATIATLSHFLRRMENFASEDDTKSRRRKGFEKSMDVAKYSVEYLDV